MTELFCTYRLFISKLKSLEPHMMVIPYYPDPTIPMAFFCSSGTFFLDLTYSLCQKCYKTRLGCFYVTAILS